ncbi:MAG: NAD(P)-dependent oxidoreductase [Cytophagaceae bacterium]|nr:NAD(P)-dependent oxidoreductase [Cytophagaceae bacterium]
MKKIKIGILREGKVPPDKRVPLLPEQCVQVMAQYPHVSIAVQPSDIRCIGNKEYADAGIPLQEDLSDYDILMGVKEVPIHLLIPNKTYTFFSHTLKKQPHNQKLLQTVLEKKITLIDYECLKDTKGNRILAFGRFAGIVGAYNAFLFYGVKYKLYDLKRAYECFDFEEMKEELDKVKIPNVKIILTGGGRVGNGAREILDYLKIRKVPCEYFLHKKFDEPVYTQLNSADYHIAKNQASFDREDFHKNPSKYECTFKQFLNKADILIAGAYWDPLAPKLFSNEDLKKNDFSIKMIADITCDINGSIPTTVKASTILEPVYDYNRSTFGLEAPFSNTDNITIMAVDNLPGEVPRDSSRDFGLQLINNVFPHLLTSDELKIVEKATIAQTGKLKPDFQYLNDYSIGG